MRDLAAAAGSIVIMVALFVQGRAQRNPNITASPNALTALIFIQFLGVVLILYGFSASGFGVAGAAVMAIAGTIARHQGYFKFPMNEFGKLPLPGKILMGLVYIGGSAALAGLVVGVVFSTP